MFHFVANLKPYTLPESVSEDRFDAYLLSADYTSGLATLASVVRAEQRVLVADNGNMDALRSLAREFATEAAELDAERKAWERTQGTYARPHQLPPTLRSRFEALAGRIAERSHAITTDDFARAAVGRQSSIDPTMLVGMEDFTLATMGSLNLEPEYMNLPSSFFEGRAERAVNFAQRTIRGDLGEIHGQVLAGLHALDFDSGVFAGRLAAEAGIEGVTVGMFGALTDRNYVDFRVEDGEIVELRTAVPRPYLRVIELAAGVLEGFRRSGRRRPAFHALGVGTPILLPLLSLLGAGEDYFATDSTAPIVDGWSSPTISLYVTEPAPLKYKAHRIAEVWIGGGRGWDCECPHCARFHEAHPPDLGRAQRWWREQGKPKIAKEMLERQGPLSPYLPFLGYPADDELRTEASLARVGHNHWVLRQLELVIRKRSERWPDLLGWVEGIVGAYQQTPGSAAWNAAVSEAFALARSIGERLHQSALQQQVEPVPLLLADDVEVEEDEGLPYHQDDQCDRDPAPHQPPKRVPMPTPSLGRTPYPPPPRVPMPTPSLVVDHCRTVSDPQQLDNRCDPSANRTPSTSDPAREIQEVNPMEHIQPLTKQSSRVLLQQTVLELGKIESIALTWDQLQPLTVTLAGLAAAMLDALQADTMMGAAELEDMAAQMEPWRLILEEAAGGESEQAQAWKEALLTAMSETVGAAKAQARLDALLAGDAALLRIVELRRRAIQLTQSPFVAAHVAATAASFRLGSLAAYLASRAHAEGEEDSSPLGTAAIEQLVSFADQAEEFVEASFQQLHDLFACDEASVGAARSLARFILDEAGGRGRLLGEVLGGVSRQGIEPNSLVELGPVVLRIAELEIRLTLLATYAAYVRAHSHSMAADSWLTSEREAAQLDPASRVPTGSRASIDQLGSLDRDQLVEVLGRVESLVIDHDPAPPKFSSFVRLRAFDGVASVRLRAHMFSLEKNGLVEGALCLVRGFVRRHESWLDADETGLDIDRVSLSKDRKESWLDDVAYRMRPFFRLYQDEMNLFQTPGGV